MTLVEWNSDKTGKFWENNNWGFYIMGSDHFRITGVKLKRYHLFIL